MERADENETVRVWLVERTYSDDEQNLIILTYATPDGEREFRKERALTSFGVDVSTPVSLEVSPSNLGAADAADQERYAGEVERMRTEYDPDEAL